MYVVPIVSYDRECIEKLSFLQFARIFRLSFVIVPIFFPENFFTAITNKTKKIIMYIHHKKALSVFPEFSNFSLHKNLIRIITNIKKNLPIFFFFLNHPCIKANKRKKNIQIGQAVFEF
jgi:hypothetical protein